MRRVEVTITVADQGPYVTTNPKFETARVTIVGGGPPTKARAILADMVEGVTDEATAYLRDVARLEREAENAADTD